MILIQTVMFYSNNNHCCCFPVIGRSPLCPHEPRDAQPLRGRSGGRKQPRGQLGRKSRHGGKPSAGRA